MKLTKVQKAALLALAFNPSMPRTKFTDRTWMALCNKGLCYPNGCFSYAYMTPIVSESGRKLALELHAKSQPKQYPPLRLVVG